MNHGPGDLGSDALHELARKAEIREVEEAVLRRRCFVCNQPDETNGGDVGFLTSIEVIIARGEGDHSQVSRWLCEHHLRITAKVLVEVGVGSHYHSGFNHLELMDCSGAQWPEDCPEPEDKNGDRT